MKFEKIGLKILLFTHSGVDDLIKDDFYFLTHPNQPYFLDITESKCNWGKRKTECNHVNNKHGAKY